MKKVVLILSIACLTFTGMAQIQQREVWNPLKKGTFHERDSIRKDRKVNTGLNNPKIQKAIKMRLDSIVSNDSKYSYSFTYNNNECVKIEHINFFWDAVNNKDVGEKTISSYSDGNVTELIVFEWNSTTQTWIEFAKYRYTYSYSDSITEGIEEEYDYDNQIWVNNWKFENVIDDNGWRTMEADYYWGDVISQWIGRFKYEYAYDNNGWQTMSAHYYWNGQWIGDYKNGYAYDDNGNRTMEYIYNWDAVNSQWEIAYASVYTYFFQYDENNNVIEAILKDEVENILEKIESAYDDNGNQTMYARYYWSGLWIGVWKYESAYDGNGNQTMYASYNWDEINNQWIRGNKSESAYDGNGNQTMDAYYNWDRVNNQWIGNYKYEYTYDDNYSLSDLLLPYDVFQSHCNTMRLEGKYFNWDEDLEDWYQDQEATTTYHYSSQNVSIKEISNTDTIKMYPNPVQNTLHLQSSTTIEQVSIYDISGRILRQIANPTQNINISNLAKGIYLVKVKTPAGEVIRKIVKE